MGRVLNVRAEVILEMGDRNMRFKGSALPANVLYVLLVTMPVFGVLIPMSARGAALEEIVVTAQKRTENVQDIPFAITALSQKVLTRSGIDGLAGYAYMVPGLDVSSQGNGRTQINIRGISSGEIRRDNTRAAPTVGIYFDEIPLSTALYNPDLEPFDLQRVEVLRGPQGTLYGSGSIAGTIRLISNPPVLNQYQGLVDTGFDSVEYGGLGYYVKGMANIPIKEDVAAARVVGYQISNAGWIDNVAPGPGGGKDVNTSDKWGFRATALWMPTPNLTIRPTYIHQSIKNDGTPVDNVQALGVQGLINVGTLLPSQTYDPTSSKYQQWKYLKQPSHDRIDIANLLWKYNFDNMKLTSSTSYTQRRIEVFADISLNNVAAGFFPAPPAATGGSVNVLGIGLDDHKAIDSFAQEVRLSSTGAGPLKWVGGGFYNYLKVKYWQPMIVTDPRGIGLNPPNPTVLGLYGPYGESPGILLGTHDHMTTEQVAAFGEATYSFWHKWDATVGLRWFDVNQNFSETSSGRLNGGVTSFSRKTTDNGVNPKFLLAYHVNDNVMVSAQASRGFRLGGPQLYVPTVSTPTLDCPADLKALGVSFNPNGYKSEHLWDYELGLKSSWLDQRLRFNASLYYIDYYNLQVTTRLNCGFSFTANAKKAVSKGVEWELQAQATDNLNIGLGGSFTDARLKSDLPSGEAVSGDRLIYVPNWKVNAQLYYTHPLTDRLKGYFNFNYEYTGSTEMFYPNATNLPLNISRTAAPYNTGNMRIGVQSDKWDAALFINNLWNEYAVTYIDSINPGGPGGWVGDTVIQPRTVGLDLRYHF